MISYYGQSYVGRRKNNQDNILTLCINKEKAIYFFAVADGMGGAAGGEIASKIAIDICKKHLIQYFEKNAEKPNLKYALQKAINNADKSIADTIGQDSTLSGMGTTLTAILIYGNKYIIGNIGDSRTYVYDDSVIKQITIDHSIIQEYKEKHSDDIDPEILKNYSHGVTKVLQGHGDEPDIFPKDKGFFALKKHTGFLLCSDGLLIDKTENDPEIFRKYCVNSKNLKKNVEQLISSAFYNGSTDNISVICIEFGKVKKHKHDIQKWPYPPKEIKQKKNSINKSIKFAIPIIVLITLFIIILSQNNKERKSPRIMHHEVDIQQEKSIPKKNTTFSFKHGGFFPQFGSYPHNFKQEGSLNLSWQTDPINPQNITYKIYLSVDLNFENPIILISNVNKKTINPTDIPKQIKDGILYWRLHAIREDKEIAVSETQKIKLKK